MPKLEVHISDCVRELGEPFEQVHNWLDEYAGMGPGHRDIRHHAAGVEKVRQMWGDRAAKAAEIHIRADTKGKLPLLKEARMWSIFNQKASTILDKEFPTNEDPQ